MLHSLRHAMPVTLAALLVLALAGCGAPVDPAASAPGSTTTTDVEPPASPARPAKAARWQAETAVGRVVAERAETARVFELLGIDYCCGGETSLQEAAQAKGLDLDRLIAALEAVGPGVAGEPARAWAEAPLAELIAHIEGTYHAGLRRDLPRLDSLVATVVRVHGETHAELSEVGRLYRTVRSAIPAHLELEEKELFPAILEAGPRDPAAVRRLLEAMRSDHDEVGAALHQIRELTNAYEPPSDACALYKQMLVGLAELERDLHAHVHLENNVLLPRAVAQLEGS